MADRFLIAPLQSENAFFGIINNYTKGYLMKIYKKRSDVIDISTGTQFSDLTVQEYAGKGKHRGAVWKCLCVCGKVCIVPGGHLRMGMRKSCGCRSESRIFETGINRVYSNYKRKAKLRDLEFSIERDVFGKLITKPCNYCGREPHQILKRLKSKKLQIMYNGIDRYDPSLGYTNNNCVSCCYYCNHGKADLTFNEWKEHLKRIFSYQGFTNGN